MCRDAGSGLTIYTGPEEEPESQLWAIGQKVAQGSGDHTAKTRRAQGEVLGGKVSQVWACTHSGYKLWILL